MPLGVQIPQRTRFGEGKTRPTDQPEHRRSRGGLRMHSLPCGCCPQSSALWGSVRPAVHGFGWCGRHCPGAPPKRNSATSRGGPGPGIISSGPADLRPQKTVASLLPSALRAAHRFLRLLRTAQGNRGPGSEHSYRAGWESRSL